MSERIVVVDLGGTKTRAALFDPSAEQLLSKTTRPTPRHGDGHAVLETVRATVDDALRGEAESLSMIVVGSVGPLDVRSGTIVRAPMFANMAMVPLAGHLQRAFGVPVHALNDANLASVGEFVYGAGRGTTDMIFLTIGTGIGGGVVTGGRLLSGARGFAGELGHVSLYRDGLRCGCGQRGCLEAHASGTAMESEAQRLIRQGVSTRMRATLEEAGTIRVEDIVQCANEGDEPARAILENAARDIGAALAGLVNVFNPECVVLGGGVANAGDSFLALIEAETRRRCIAPFAEGLRIVRSALGDEATLYGGLAIAARRIPWPPDLR